MKKIIILLFSLYSFSFGAITLKLVDFNDIEENQSTFVISYQSQQYLSDLPLSSQRVTNVLTCRNNGTPTLTCISNAGFTTADLLRVREAGYLQENQPINALGIKTFDYNFLMALLGLLIGVLFAFGLIYSVMNISRERL